MCVCVCVFSPAVLSSLLAFVHSLIHSCMSKTDRQNGIFLTDKRHVVRVSDSMAITTRRETASLSVLTRAAEIYAFMGMNAQVPTAVSAYLWVGGAPHSLTHSPDR